MAKKARALRYEGAVTRKVMHRTGSAAQTIGRLDPGVRGTGLTAGQFSAVDALEHMVDCLGPAVVRVSTWTTGLYDAQRAAAIKVSGRITDIRMLLDRGTFEKSPQFAGPLIQSLGPGAFRCLSVHAKVIIVTGERGSAVFRSSMNLNKNLRTEQFDIDVADDVARFYETWFDGLWDESGRSTDNRTIIRNVYDRYRAGLADVAEEEKSAPVARRAAKAEEAVFAMDDLSDLIGD